MAFLDVNNIKIHYQLIGNGEKLIVFNHGLVMDNLSSWYFTLGNKITTISRALLYDIRGHGKSARPESGYHVDDLVQDLTGLLTGLNIHENIYLVGNSFGGLLSLAFAMKYPERINGIVLVDSHLSDEGFAAEMKSTLELQGPERDIMIAKSFKNWVGRHIERKRNKLAETAAALVYHTDLVQDLQTSKIFSDAELQRITCPVLAIYGEKSDIREKGERLANMLPNCDHRIFPGCTHSVVWEATDRLCNQVIQWIILN